MALGILRPGIREDAMFLGSAGEASVQGVVLAVLLRAAEMTAVRMVLAVAEDGLVAVRDWDSGWVSEFGATRLDTRVVAPLTKANWVLPGPFS